MPIDRKHIGFRLPPFVSSVDVERLTRFTEAIGLSEPPAIAPPTYLKVIEGEHNSSRSILEALGVNLRGVLHVEQEFDYGAPIRAGDEVTVERAVIDIYDRKAGALEFILIESILRNAAGNHVGTSRQLIAVRNAAPA
jgi:N-terminal half of MaoC dehydratase